MGELLASSAAERLVDNQAQRSPDLKPVNLYGKPERSWGLRLRRVHRIDNTALQILRALYRLGCFSARKIFMFEMKPIPLSQPQSSPYFIK